MRDEDGEGFAADSFVVGENRENVEAVVGLVVGRADVQQDEKNGVGSKWDCMG